MLFIKMASALLYLEISEAAYGARFPIICRMCPEPSPFSETAPSVTKPFLFASSVSHCLCRRQGPVYPTISATFLELLWITMVSLSYELCGSF